MSKRVKLYVAPEVEAAPLRQPSQLINYPWPFAMTVTADRGLVRNVAAPEPPKRAKPSDLPIRPAKRP